MRFVAALLLATGVLGAGHADANGGGTLPQKSAAEDGVSIAADVSACRAELSGELAAFATSLTGAESPKPGEDTKTKQAGGGQESPAQPPAPAQPPTPAPAAKKMDQAGFVKSLGSVLSRCLGETFDGSTCRYVLTTFASEFETRVKTAKGLPEELASNQLQVLGRYVSFCQAPVETMASMCREDVLVSTFDQLKKRLSSSSPTPGLSELLKPKDIPTSGPKPVPAKEEPTAPKSTTFATSPPQVVPKTAAPAATSPEEDAARQADAAAKAKNEAAQAQTQTSFFSACPEAASVMRKLQTSNVEREICTFKQQRFPAFLRAYYASLGLGGDGHESYSLQVRSARFGDLRHGHACDATTYFKRRCKALQGLVPASDTDPSRMTADTREAAGDAYCLIRRQGKAPGTGTDASMRSDLCGYDPSPQAESLSIRIDYSCGGRQQEPLNLPFDTWNINIVCALPGEAEHYRQLSADQWKKEMQFFADDPCPMPVNKLGGAADNKSGAADGKPGTTDGKPGTADSKTGTATKSPSTQAGQ